MPGYFEIEFMGTSYTSGDVSKVLEVRSIEGYKGNVTINFSYVGTGSPTFSTPNPSYAFLDEDEEMSVPVTLTGGATGNSGNLKANASDGQDTDYDEIPVSFP